MNPNNNKRYRKILPLAITVGNDEVCVAGVSEDLTWIRPMTPTLEEISGDRPVFAYDQWSLLILKGRPSNARVEDWSYASAREDGLVNAEDRCALFTRASRECVAAAFEDERTAGLIEARVIEIYLRQHTGGRQYLRIRFEDRAGERYDWVCPERRLTRLLRPPGADDINTERKARLNRLFEDKTWLAIGLGDKNDRFPGIFDGRHPLCTGLHFEAYAAREVHDLLSG